MSIPKLNVSESSAGRGAAHDILPLIVACIDAWNLPLSFDSINELGNILAIRSSSALSPRTSTGWVRLDVEPDHSVVSVF